MLKIENTNVVGFEEAIRGMRNPLNSWEKSDSSFNHEDGEYHDICGNIGPSLEDAGTIVLGQNDKDLMKRLASAGKDHAKYRRMIVVYADLIAPLYWWKEYDTYKVGTVANSCSTMHKIQAKEFTLDDFSHEHLIGMPTYVHDIDKLHDEIPLVRWDKASDRPNDGYWVEFTPLGTMTIIIEMLNRCRELYLETKDKGYWWQMIQLLPSSYNQRRTVMLNYEVLANIYPARKAHKLDEWHTFCDWIKSLPYSWIITGEEKK